jgi:hypothetical protein
VLVAWFLWYVVRTRPRDPLVQARKEARLAALQARTRKFAAPVQVAEEVTPPPPSGDKKSEGGEPHA